MRIQLDLEELRVGIRAMSMRSQLYRVLKEELTKRGYWKLRKRGKPNLMFKRSQ